MIRKQDILDRAAEWGLAAEVVEKDYVLGWLLVGIAKHAETAANWIFKGGTCLKKCFFETYRFSEDLDFSLLPQAAYSEEALAKTLSEVQANVHDLSGLTFGDVVVKPRHNKKGDQTFEARLYYRGPREAPNPAKVSFDLSRHEKVFPPFEQRAIFHAYPDALPDGILVPAYSFPELLAEKLRALVERTRPRDLYDVVFILENRRSEIDLARTREVFFQKCAFKSIATPSATDLVALVRNSAELKADWQGMLGHQLPQLPPIEPVLARLDGLFDWLAGVVPTVVPAPITIPFKPGEQPFSAPPGIGVWGPRGTGLEAIRFAGANRLLVSFMYTNKRGETERRTIEPYSLRTASTGNLILYGFDRIRDDVRSFIVANIRAVEITQQVFTPRYPIELTTSGPFHAPPVEGRRRSPRSFGASYVFACVVCGREFRHTANNPKINRHRDQHGCECSGRHGYLVRMN